MDDVGEIVRPRRTREAGRTVQPPVALTGVVAGCLAGGLVVLASFLTSVTSPASWSPVIVLWAVPAGLGCGASLILLLRWRLAEAAAVVQRFTDLAGRADDLSQQLADRSAEQPAPGRLRMPGEDTAGGTAPVLDQAGRRRAGQAAAVAVGNAPAPVAAAVAEQNSRSVNDPGTAVTGVINQLLSVLDTEHSYRSIVDATGDVVLLVDSFGQIAVASDSVQQVLGIDPAQMTNQPLARYVHAGDLEPLLDLLEDFDAEARSERRTPRPRLRMRAGDGSWRILEWVFLQWPADLSGSTLLTGRDVTEQVQLQEELVHQAQHDSLTGLPNRMALIARLAELVVYASPIRPVAVLMIDLDRFKLINDSLGHAMGDALLTQVGGRLRSVLRPGDMLARLGGDEFAVVVQTGGLDGAEMVAQRLASQLEDPFTVDGAVLSVDASIGISISHGTPRSEPADSATLLSEADIAMYRAKGSGAAVAVFELERDQAKSKRREISDELRAGIANDELVLHYQPIIDIRNTRVAGLEALARWQHPRRGLLQPSEFLAIAEETGLIARLSLAVLDQALAQAARWVEQGWPLPVAVNLSPNWLHQADVPAEVEEALARHGVPASLLRLEITEAAVIVDPEQSLARLHRLRDLGIRLSLDDFGTGFSSMTHLRTLPIDQLKVDRQFVGTMVTTEQDAVIVRAAIELGHNLGLSVVAEGVEDPDTLARVMGAGCSLAQGYYLARPMPPDEVLAWIEPRFPAKPDRLAS